MGKRSRETRVDGDFIVGGTFHLYTIASRADLVVVDSSDALQRLPDLPQVIKVPQGGSYA